jgi:hypothetical protein
MPRAAVRALIEAGAYADRFGCQRGVLGTFLGKQSIIGFYTTRIKAADVEHVPFFCRGHRNQGGQTHSCGALQLAEVAGGVLFFELEQHTLVEPWAQPFYTRAAIEPKAAQCAKIVKSAAGSSKL